MTLPTFAPLIWPDQDPNELLDYKVDWSDTNALGSDTIAVSTWDVPTGLTKQSDTFDSTSATIWLQDGVEGKTYELVNHIVTVAGRKYDQSVQITIRSR